MSKYEKIKNFKITKELVLSVGDIAKTYDKMVEKVGEEKANNSLNALIAHMKLIKDKIIEEVENESWI